MDLALVSAWRGVVSPQLHDAVQDVLRRDATELSPPLRARAHTVRAELALAGGNVEEAIAAADEALRHDAEEPYALYAKARALASRKDAGAAQAFMAAVARRRTAPVLYFGGATTLVRAGDVEGARSLLDGYEATFRDVKLATTTGEQEAYLERDDRYWLARGDVLREAGDLEGALGAYDKAIAAKSLNQPRAHYAKGVLFLGRKEYAKAKESLSLVTPQDGSGTVPEAYYAMGELLFDEKDYATGCQNFAFALTRLRAQGMPRPRLDELIADVDRRLVAADQKPLSELWRKEATALIR
ncbi:MAG: tetratricopeptide repeat protein [Myxococcaceae bacterium]|nr:tetratricopeptide repeat protein [Myxococcaceae bacterium]